jgi:hypothetical protein
MLTFGCMGMSFDSVFALVCSVLVLVMVLVEVCLART